MICEWEMFKTQNPRSSLYLPVFRINTPPGMGRSSGAITEAIAAPWVNMGGPSNSPFSSGPQCLTRYPRLEFCTWMHVLALEELNCKTMPLGHPSIRFWHKIPPLLSTTHTLMGLARWTVGTAAIAPSQIVVAAANVSELKVRVFGDVSVLISREMVKRNKNLDTNYQLPNFYKWTISGYPTWHVFGWQKKITNEPNVVIALDARSLLTVHTETLPFRAEGFTYFSW